MQDLGFISWLDPYVEYENMLSPVFHTAVKEENTIYDKAIQKIDKHKLNRWKQAFNKLPTTYDVFYSFTCIKYKIDISPDNRYIPTLTISVKDKHIHVFKAVTTYGNTDTLFWFIADSTDGQEDLSLFIYDKHFELVKTIKQVGDTAVNTKTEIFYTGAYDYFWYNKIYKINNSLETTLLYEEQVEKYSLSLDLPSDQDDIFITRRSALYQDIGILTYNKKQNIQWLTTGFGTKLPIDKTTIAYDTYFEKNNKMIKYPKDRYIKSTFKRKNRSELYFIFTNDAKDSLYLYDTKTNSWALIRPPSTCDLKYISELDFILVGTPNAPDELFKLTKENDLVLEKTYKGPKFDLSTGNTNTGVPWFSISDDKQSQKGLVVYGYGSYGMSLRKGQQRLWIPWVEMGYTVVFLGIRGGRDNGDIWWDQSRTSGRRINGLMDFVNGTRYLQQTLGFNKRNTIIFGRSAGGFLVTAVSKFLLNDIAVIYAAKAYTDYLCTASNLKARQTVQEGDEFGLATNPVDFLNILKISPQENIVKNPKTNPAVVLTGGLHDSEVPVYMPLKYIKALHDSNWKNAYMRISNEGHFTKPSLEFREAEDAALIESLIK
jgi:protease II